MLDNEARYQSIQSYVANKKVLDIGIVQHNLESVDSDSWLHEWIVEDAAEVTGIDILEDEINRLQERGYDARQANAEDFDLDESYDVIVAGELIEHLSNVGDFLDCCRQHLREDGRLVLTTPNGMSVVFPARRILNYEVHNPEHTCIFDEQTLSQLLKRHSFDVEDVEFIKTNQIHSIHPKQILTEILERVPPDRISHQTLMTVARPD